MIMLDEVLKHSNLGSKTEIGFILFKALSPGKLHSTSDVITFCTSNLFSISSSINGVIKLLKFTSILEVIEETVTLNLNVFNPNKFKSEVEYFNSEHFYRLFLTQLIYIDCLKELFNEKNLKFSKEKDVYYVKSHLIKLKYFPLRNLLISLNFLIPDESVPSDLFVNPRFTDLFKSIVIKKLNENVKKRRLTINQLKKKLELQEAAGKESELFVLNFEKTRLNSHPDVTLIERISDEYVNAGYDIFSFNNLESVVNDRFV